MKWFHCAYMTFLGVSMAAGLGRAADTNKGKIVGTWVVTKEGSLLAKGTTLHLTKDGKLRLDVEVAVGKKVRKVSVKGTYKLDGDKLTSSTKTPDGKDERETMTIIKLTDKVLHIKNADGKITEFEKK